MLNRIFSPKSKPGYPVAPPENNKLINLRDMDEFEDDPNPDSDEFDDSLSETQAKSPNNKINFKSTGGNSQNASAFALKKNQGHHDELTTESGDDLSEVDEGLAVSKPLIGLKVNSVGQNQAKYGGIQRKVNIGRVVNLNVNQHNGFLIKGFGGQAGIEISKINPGQETDDSPPDSHRQFIVDVQKDQFDAMQMDLGDYDEMYEADPQYADVDYIERGLETRQMNGYVTQKAFTNFQDKRAYYMQPYIRHSGGVVIPEAFIRTFQLKMVGKRVNITTKAKNNLKRFENKQRQLEKQKILHQYSKAAKSQRMNTKPFRNYAGRSPLKNKYDLKEHTPEYRPSPKRGSRRRSQRLEERIVSQVHGLVYTVDRHSQRSKSRGKHRPRILSADGHRNPSYMSPRAQPRICLKSPSFSPATNANKNIYVQSKYKETKKYVFELMKDAYHRKLDLQQEKEIREAQRLYQIPDSFKSTYRESQRPQWDNNFSRKQTAILQQQRDKEEVDEIIQNTQRPKSFIQPRSRQPLQKIQPQKTEVTPVFNRLVCDSAKRRKLGLTDPQTPNEGIHTPDK